jgi:hypothetical protein
LSATWIKAAKFYESVFDLKRVGRDDLEFASGIYLSDGVVNLAFSNIMARRAQDSRTRARSSAHIT